MMPGNPARRGLRLARLRRVLGDRDRARPAALVPHPDRPQLRVRHQRARPDDERLPLHHPRLPGHHGHARARRRVRAPSDAARRLRRGRRRLGAALHVPHGPRLQAPPQLAAGRARSSRSCPSEYFRENIYTTFQDDWVAFKTADLMNWRAPDVGERLPAQRLDLAVVAGDARRAPGRPRRGPAATPILCGNVAELYGIDVSGLRAGPPPTGDA